MKTLSDKEETDENWNYDEGCYEPVYYKEDVKEFIKDIEGIMCNVLISPKERIRRFRERAGDKLI